MGNEVVPVNIRGIVPNEGGCTLFLGNDDKVFVIHVDRNIGEVIANFINGVSKERPLTHDLINHIFKGFGTSLERFGGRSVARRRHRAAGGWVWRAAFSQADKTAHGQQFQSGFPGFLRGRSLEASRGPLPTQGTGMAR